LKLLFRWIAVIAIFSLSSACGKFEVYVEIRPTHPTLPASPSSTPGGNSAIQSPVLTPINTPTIQPGITIVPSELPLANTATTTPQAPTTPEPRKLKAGTPLNIITLSMLDASQGWAVGQVDIDLNDRILSTDDGGQTWQDRTPYAALSMAPSEGLSAIAAFGTAQNAWVTYAALSSQFSQKQAIVWLTRDGGVNWQTSEVLDFAGIAPSYYQPDSMGFLPDLRHGWLLVHLGATVSQDDVAIFTTSDGGETWQRMVDPQKNPDLMTCAKSALVFSTDQIAWLAGNCPGLIPAPFLYRSTDGGHTWTSSNLPPPNGQPSNFFSGKPYACGITNWVYTASRDLMFLLRCENPVQNLTLSWLYSSYDGGLTWQAYPIPVPFGELSFRTKGEGWLLGAFNNASAANQELYHSIDSGRSWTPVLPVGWQGKPEFVTSMKGWVAAQSRGDRALVRTTDGAKTWEVINPVIGP
jgi:photosystem II stability/assembly factor-like uncharacterized protein